MSLQYLKTFNASLSIQDETQIDPNLTALPLGSPVR